MGDCCEFSRDEGFPEQFERMIMEHGWACQAVIDHNGEPGWVYTVGLEDRGHPEMIMVGVEPRVGGQILNAVADAATNGIRPWPRAGHVVEDILTPGSQLRVLAVDDEVVRAGAWFNTALWRRGSRADFSALQLVWRHHGQPWPTETTEKQALLGAPWWKADHP